MSVPTKSGISDAEDPDVSAEELRALLGNPGAEGDATGLDFEALRGAVSEERGARAWLRSRPTPIRIAFAATAVLAAALMVGRFALRADAAVYPATRMTLLLGAMAVALGVGLVLALRALTSPALPAWVTRAFGWGALGVLAALYLLPAAHVADPASVHPAGLGPFVAHAGACLGVGLVPAFACFAWLRVLDRGDGLSSTASAAALASAIAGNVVLQLMCPITAPAHLLAGHLPILAVLWGTSVGALRRA